MIEPNNPRCRTTCAVLAAVCLLYLAGVNDRWYPTPDSSLYVGLGRNVADGEGYQFLGRSGRQREPVIPLLAAANHALFGDHFLPINLLYALMGVGVAACTWRIARQAGEQLVPDSPARDALARAVALGALVAVALSYRNYRESHRVLMDLPFTFLAAAGFWAAGRIARSAWWSIPAWALLTLATLTRTIGGAMLAALGVALLLGGRLAGDARVPWRRRILGLLPAIAAAGVLAAWLFGYALADPSATGTMTEFSSQAGRNLLDRLDDVGLGLLMLPTVCLETFWGQDPPGIGWAFFAIMLVGAGALVRRRQWLLVTPGALYLLALVPLGTHVMQSRYLLPVVPWLAIWFLCGVAALAVPLYRRAPKLGLNLHNPAGALVWGGVALLAIVPLPRVAREIYYLRHPDFLTHVDEGKWLAYYAAADWIGDNLPPEATVFSDEATLLHYLSRRPTRTWETGNPAIGNQAFATWPDAAAGASADFILLPAGRDFTPDVRAQLDADPRFTLHHAHLPAPASPADSDANLEGFLVYRRVDVPASRPE